MAGPLLVSFICALAMRQRLSRARIREFLHDWSGLDLGVATINQCIHEAGRAVEPVVEQEILSAVREAEVLYADETSWKEHRQLLWLWVFTCATATFFIEISGVNTLYSFLNSSTLKELVLPTYKVYREYAWRLRCLAHILPGFQFRKTDLLLRSSLSSLRDDPIYRGFLFPDWRRAEQARDQAARERDQAARQCDQEAQLRRQAEQERDATVQARVDAVANLHTMGLLPE